MSVGKAEKITRARSAECGFRIYMAALGGALVQAVSDTAINDTQSVMARAGDRLFAFNGDATVRWGLAVMTMASVAVFLCWIFTPRNRKDAFYRGFSVIAVLTLAFPSQVTPGVSASNHAPPVVPSGPRGTTDATLVVNLEYISTDVPSHMQQRYGTADVEISGEDGTTDLDLSVTLRDFERERIVAQQRYFGGRFTVEQSVGQYLLDIESPGYRRTRAVIDVGYEPRLYQVVIKSTDAPIPIQRLYPPDEVQPIAR